ncbi:RNA polymerase sigma factor [uncultured Amnibacterium sp.]|uniref:RNA polymerase sigma factor n=1 Tax=uncultured Amnibacterium sp. TaxID=1631851 RepID=UPI0035CB38D6
MSASDTELVQQSLTAPQAFSELFRRHSGAVYGYVARRAGRDVADEVLSETFLVAFERRDRFRSDATSARPWLLGIATNVVHAYRRKEARHLHLLQQLQEPVLGDGGIPRAGDRMDAAARLRDLGDRIRNLPAGDRDVLLLHAWADLTAEQIAVALDIPVGTVWSRLNRVRRTLRDAAGTAGKEHPAWTS